MNNKKHWLDGYIPTKKDIDKTFRELLTLEVLEETFNRMRQNCDNEEKFAIYVDKYWSTLEGTGV